MPEEFISEAIQPATASMSATVLATGVPDVPSSFTWRGDEYTVDTVLDDWKGLGDCSHGSGETYVKKHWFHVRTSDGAEMKIYFDRQPRRGQKDAPRWFLYTMARPD